MCLSYSLFRAIVVVVAAIIVAPTVGQAATIFESGTLGPTGVTLDDLQDRTVPGTNVNRTVYPGVRFQLSQPVVTTQAGGHFVAGSLGTFFAAIVELDDENDFPDSRDLSTPDVRGTTLITVPELSDDVFGNLSVSLEPGWYALVFGSELFGATSSGGAVRNGTDIGDPSYIVHEPNLGWTNLDRFQNPFDNHRFVLKGYVVPEPSTMAILTTALLICASCRTVRRGGGRQ